MYPVEKGLGNCLVQRCCQSLKRMLLILFKDSLLTRCSRFAISNPNPLSLQLNNQMIEERMIPFSPLPRKYCCAGSAILLTRAFNIEV